MIVRSSLRHLLLITQPDHARLARRIMERCVPLAAHPRRDVILHAIQEHDNGWSEEDASPTVNSSTGEIVDFVNAPAEVRQRVWTRGVARLADDPWAAALVAQHAIVIYDRFHSDAAWAPFFDAMRLERDSMIRATGGAPDDLRSDYEFVRLADLTSLTFCTGWTGEQRFGDWVVQLSGTRVFTPDVFGGAEIPIDIVANDIANRRFSSNDELREALRGAATRTLRGTVVGTHAAV
jgi:Protein of unknown function (DUF3891)